MSGIASIFMKAVEVSEKVLEHSVTTEVVLQDIDTAIETLNNQTVEPAYAEALNIHNIEHSVKVNMNEVNEAKFKTVDQALENASDAEIAIYKGADLKLEEVNGREVLQRIDIDYDAVDALGQTNLERMAEGKAPLVDGNPIELHHIGQEMNSPLAELTRMEHRGPGNDTILHDKLKESEINRTQFNMEKEAHWKARAEQIRTERGI